ncbi:FtsX-like permease family protein [Micromonospora aurantiaca (nom. illeg.)]|uniref:FtsX-like permease family protein n=1 Tax=Micromonospora aurantiaca (nom. illeg.) TaxID=47850 RepID=UPI0034395C1C
MRLALRLLRGGGRSGVLRLVLVICGIALGVVASCLVAVLPGVLDNRAEVMNARDPQPAADGQDHLFVFSPAVDVWKGQRLGRLFIADVRPGTAAAPGVERLPGPAEVVASPALAAALRSDPELRTVVPGHVIGEIKPSGLVDQHELFAYVGVAVDEVTEPHDGVGFGTYDTLTLKKQQTGLTQSLALLVLPPVVAYLVVCGRLASATRARRYSALRLIGVRSDTALRLAFVESAILGIAGALLGILLFELLHPLLAESNALGFTWFAQNARFGPVATTLLVIAVGVTAGLVGSAGLRRSLARPLTARVDVAEPKPRPFLLLPLIFGFGAVSFLLLSAPQNVARGTRLAMSDTTAYVAIGAVAIMLLGLLLGLRPIIAASARLLSVARLPLSVRMAGSRLALQPATTLRLLTGLALLVLVAGVSSGVLKDMELRSNPQAANYSVDIEGVAEASTAARETIFDLPARFKWNSQSSIVDFSAPPAGDGVVAQARAAGYRLVTINCSSLRQLVRMPLTECRSGETYRLTGTEMVGTAFEIPPGTEFDFARADGGKELVKVPEQRLVVPDDAPFPIQAFGALYIATDGPAFGWSKEVSSSFLVEPDPQKLTDFKTAVARIAPTMKVRVWGEDLDLMELVRNQRGVISFGVFVGFLVAIIAFGVAVIDHATERRRDVAVLMVVGMRKRTIRAIQITQLLAALVTVLTASAIASYLAGNLALRLNDVNRDWYAGPLDAMAPFLVSSLVVAVVTGSFVVVRRLRSEDLKRE